MTTFEHLQQILAADYNLPVDRLVPAARLDELGIDSLGVMELLFRIEDEFGVKLPHELSELPPLATVGDVADAIDALLAQQHQEPGQRERQDQEQQCAPQDGAQPAPQRTP